MPQPKRSTGTFTQVGPSGASRQAQSLVRPVDGSHQAHPSPARSLMDDLSERWIEPSETDEKKWSPRATLALSVGASVGLWGLIGLAVRALL